MNNIRLSPHARAMMRAREVSFDEVMDVLRNYEQRRESAFHNGRETPNTFIYSKGQLSVVVHESPEVWSVKTVLLRTSERWNDADARARTRGGSSSQ